VHEAHAVQAIVNQLIKKANANKASRVLKVRLILGEFTGFAEESIRLYFEAFVKGTKLEESELIIKPLKGSREFYIEDMEIENGE
jgi:Zn finger protein HypA/HybF involved in hydrogenase expression